MKRWLLLLLLLPLMGGMATTAQAGEVPGVRAEYFNWSGNGTPSFPGTAAVVDRTESNINVYLATSSPATGIGADNYLVRYTGSILIPTTGNYTFQVETDDGTRFYLDCNNNGSLSGSELLINQWNEQSTATYTASCPGTLTAGTRYAFRYEYYERGGESSARLSWTGPAPVGSTMTVIPRGTGTQGLYSGVFDTTKPTIDSTSLQCGANSLVYVAFSEQMDSTTAQTAANYTLSGGHSVTAASLLSDGVTVALTVSPGLSTSRTLTVNNVSDIAGNTIVAGSTASVIYASASLSAGLKGTYYDQAGVGGAFFTGSTATRVDSTVNFDWGGGTPGVTGIAADNFSVRWTGLILVPTTGNYVFRTLSDDGVRLNVNGNLVINNWSDHGAAYNSSASISLSAGSYIPVTLEYYERGGSAVIALEWDPPGAGSFVTIPTSQLFYCTAAALGGFTLSASSGTTSTCAPKDVTLTARDTSGNPLTTYTGTAQLTTSTARGDWTAGTGPAPSGVLANGTANDGAATYTFATGDAGVVKLKLAETLAQDVTITASDATVSGSSSTSAAIAFRDNAFVFAEDASNLIAGTDVAVAGRAHDYTVSLIKKDPSTGSCGVATDFNGSRTLKMWRTDSSGTWTAPAVASPALTVPAAQPGANNLTLSFASGVASFNLATTDIGRYALNLLDDSLSYASLAISGSSNTLTVRPFAIVVQGIKQGTTNNPGGSLFSDSVFAKAGSSFQATVGAYRWASAADANNDGVPDAGATLANTTAGGLAPSYSSTVALVPLAASQTPAGGVLGSLNNGSVSGFSGGSATPATLQYTEVGSFALNPSSVATAFLGSAVSLDATVFNASGVQSTRVGRFTPAQFALSAASVTQRSTAACTPASTFTYLNENFQLAFTLTAQNALGATTLNYTGSFAKLDPATAANWQLAGIDGSTAFLTTGGTPRLSVGTATGSWSNGVASGITLSAAALRGTTPDGPFNAAIGIAPTDSDGVALASYDIDTATPAGNDHAAVATVPLRFGRLRLMNGMGSQDRALNLPLVAQHWNGTAFVDNTLDNCTRIPATAVNFGNYRKTLTTADTVASGSAVTLSAGRGTLVLAKPLAGHTGTVDVALSLGGTATDASCLQPWTPGTGDAATAGAALSYLRGAWCATTYDKDPSARASFGLYRGADNLIYQRENY